MTGDIVITITVKPLKGGKRPVIVSAAPAGEMPVIVTGFFQEHEALFQAVWIELLTRKPKIVKNTKAEKAGEATEFPDEPEAEKKPERKCRICGCTDAQACEGGCTWIGDDLCSNCEEKVLAEIKAPKPDQLVRQEELPAIEGEVA